MKKNNKKSSKLNSKTKFILFCVGGALALFLMYYLFLPVFNFHSAGMYIYLSFIASYFLTIFFLVSNTRILKNKNGEEYYMGYSINRMTGKLERVQKRIENKYSVFNTVSKSIGITLTICVILIVFLSIFGAHIFNAKKYYAQLDVETCDSEEFETVFNYETGDVKLPILDSELAFKLAQSKLSLYGAQYTIDFDNFTLISVTRNGEDNLVRIAPLEYSNLFVSLSRINQGTAGYIEVNVITKEAKIVEFEDGLKYMPSAKFSKDLDRHIRFHYPSEITSTKYFEIDDDGNPYWIVPTISKEIGVFGGTNSKGVIIVNPINGDINRYDLGDEPSWVDRSVIETIGDTQATNYFKYKNGWFNAVFGQKKEVFQMSDGYNYFIKNGTTYYVSCVTSPNENDQTSIGFVTIDLKTKNASFYPIEGITEMRAREIAEGDYRVKAQEFTATWPILIDYEGVPTYFVVLKNDVQPQMIVFIDVETGIKVGMGETIAEAKHNYESLLNLVNESEETDIVTITDVIRTDTKIEFMVDGDTSSYFVYYIDDTTDASIRFMKTGDTYKITYTKEEYFNLVSAIEKQ